MYEAKTGRPGHLGVGRESRGLLRLCRRLWRETRRWYYGRPEGHIEVPVAEKEPPIGRGRFVVDMSVFEPFGQMLEVCEGEGRDLIGAVFLDDVGLAWEVLELHGEVTARVVSAVIRVPLEQRRLEAVRSVEESGRGWSLEPTEFQAEERERKARASIRNLGKDRDALLATGHYRETADPRIFEWVDPD